MTVDRLGRLVSMFNAVEIDANVLYAGRIEVRQEPEPASEAADHELASTFSPSARGPPLAFGETCRSPR